MIVSEARILANRANALRSSGPRTAEGKERSRANSFQHGMTGAGVVVAAEEAEAVGRRVIDFLHDFRPVTDSGIELARRAAVLSVRLDRSEAHESAAISARVLTAFEDFDAKRLDEVDRLMARLADEPARAARQLRRMPEGIDRMIATWGALRSDLADTSGRPWTDRHQAMAENLTGRRPDDFGVSLVEMFSRAIRGDFSLLGADDAPGLDRDGRREWARRELVGLIDAEVEGLREEASTLDVDAIDALRRLAPDLALFDPGKEATLARRHEAAAERGMYRALKEMREVEAAHDPSSPPMPRPAPIASPPPSPSRMGSFSPPPPSPAPSHPGPPDRLPPAPAASAGSARGEVGPTIGRTP